MIEMHGRPSRRSLVVRTAARAVAKPVMTFHPVSGPIAPLRHVIDLGARALPRLPSTRLERIRGKDWAGELVTPRGGATGDGAIVYFHGGAFLFCGLATHRRIVERLALRTGLPVLSVGYRQHGKGNVETSIADCVDATNWMIERGHAPEHVVLAGDSAGGHLAFAVALEATSQGIDLAGVVGLSPWLEFDNTERSLHANARRDHYIPTKRLQRIACTVTGKAILDPQLSPVNRDLTGLPPSLIMCAADEILRFDAELMAERLDAAGVPIDLHVWAGQVHAFPVLGELLPESSRALDLIADFVEESVSEAAATSTRARRSARRRRRLRAVPDLAV